jgi:anti-sigma-K factor RskA
MNWAGEVHHLAAAYALDALDPDERLAFEQHYPTCEVCRADTVAFRETLGELAAADPVSPPAAIRESVMAEIGRTRQMSPRVSAIGDLAARRSRRLGVILAVAAAVVTLVVAAAVVVSSSSRSFGDEVASVLDEPDATLLALDGSGVGEVRVAWSVAAGSGVLIADGLEPPPDGLAYELWSITEDGPVPMRVLDTADDGAIRATVQIAAPPIAWGVTVEPIGGSPAPTGEILFVAEV